MYTREANAGDGRPFANANSVCVACGKKGCWLRTCTAKCPKCGLNICKGTRGESCDVEADDPPVNPKNATGRPLPEHLADKLKKAHADYHKKKEASTGVSMAVYRSAAPVITSHTLSIRLFLPGCSTKRRPKAVDSRLATGRL